MLNREVTGRNGKNVGVISDVSPWQKAGICPPVLHEIPWIKYGTHLISSILRSSYPEAETLRGEFRGPLWD